MSEHAALLARLERYYDTVPRASADSREVGPFTVFVAREGWPFYARPRLGVEAFGPRDVRRVLDTQRELGLPRQIEWVHEVTPQLLPASLAAGQLVQECPLLVLGEPLQACVPAGFSVAMLEADDPRLAATQAAVDAGFSGSDDIRLRPVPDWLGARMRNGWLRVASAFDSRDAAVGGGSHSPRADVSELTGISVLPRARRQGVGATLTAVLAQDAAAAGVTTVFLSADTDAVARVYERVGFLRVGTACIIEGTA
ncbi:MAG: GNAT family N-acetyltransferase [Nocardioidaceae bacterium]|nr:GNAT family N-acetyltransferase [Nocardioidaceae bacterium]